MTAYLIVYGLDPSDRFAAFSYPTREAARLAERYLVPAVPVDGYGRPDESRPLRPGVGGCGYILENEEDAAFNGRLLVAVYNALTGKTVNKFENGAVGVKRLMAALPECAQPAPEGPALPQPTVTQEKKMDEVVTKRGRKSKFSEDDYITVVKMGVRSTGKNAGRYIGIQNGITVGQALASGALSGDLAYAVKRGWITIHNQNAVAA